MHASFQRIIENARPKERRRVVISGKRNSAALAAVLTAQDKGWIDPVGCNGASLKLRDKMDVYCADSDIWHAREDALRVLDEGEAEALLDMGPLDERFFSLLIKSDTRIKKNHLLSYVTVFTAPKNDRMTLFTDTLINSAPGLKEKAKIIENAIHVAKALGIARPNVAALSALELVNPSIPSTLDAAILSKMSERRQFQDAIVEGPLGMDNAESGLAAQHKGIRSPVPGNVDVYLFPDLESASLTTQFLAFLGPCPLGGVLAGTRVPIIIRSPLEPLDSWLLNIALGLIVNKEI